MPLYSSGQVDGVRAAFFSASGSFTVPAGIYKVLVTAVKGGYYAAAGSLITVTRFKIKQELAVTPGQVLTVTIGAAGAPGANSGGATSVGSVLVDSTTGDVFNPAAPVLGPFGMPGNAAPAPWGGAALIEW